MFMLVIVTLDYHIQFTMQMTYTNDLKRKGSNSNILFSTLCILLHSIMIIMIYVNSDYHRNMLHRKFDNNMNKMNELLKQTILLRDSNRRSDRRTLCVGAEGFHCIQPSVPVWCLLVQGEWGHYVEPPVQMGALDVDPCMMPNCVVPSESNPPNGISLYWYPSVWDPV